MNVSLSWTPASLPITLEHLRSALLDYIRCLGGSVIVSCFIPQLESSVTSLARFVCMWCWQFQQFIVKHMLSLGLAHA